MRPRADIKTWWRARELQVYLSLALFFLALLAIGVVLNLGALVGLSLLLVILFGTYSIYGYLRRER